MAYISPNTDNFIENLITREEFFWTKRWKHEEPKKYSDIIPRYLLNDAIKRSHNIELTGYQLFANNYLNPNTPYKYLLLDYNTGAGKTMASLAIALNFIEIYRKEQEAGFAQIGTVFVIGFSEKVFRNELLRIPSFGFLSRDERKHLEKLKRVASHGDPSDILKYREFVIKIHKRFGNRKKNGFFKFYGYKEFFNRIFITVDKSINITELSEHQILLNIKNGSIKYNELLLKSFTNSLVICDEIHNTYNSFEKNNYGIAIQAVIDNIPSCRAVYMSATPLSNSPTECIDLLNLLHAGETKEGFKHLKKSDFFVNDKILKPDALERIGKLVQGKISFIRDVNPQYYPELINYGTTLKQIPYLQFIRCPMSSFHYKTYKDVFKGVLSQDSQYLNDFIIENPDDPNTGLYQTSQIKKLSSAKQSWKDRYGFDYRNNRIVGNALQKESLKKYSNKYATMLDYIHEIIKLGRGKLFIYHNVVHMSGVLFIEQVLQNNGIIDEFGASTSNTLCVICGKEKRHHGKSQLTDKLGKGESDEASGEKSDEISDEKSDEKIEIIQPKVGTPCNQEDIVYDVADIDLQQKNDRIIWTSGEQTMLIIRIYPAYYEIRTEDMNFNTNEYFSELGRVISQLNVYNNKKIPIKSVQVILSPNHKLLGEWLLSNKFEYVDVNKDNKYRLIRYTTEINNKESCTGGKSHHKEHREHREHREHEKRYKYDEKHLFTPVRYIIVHNEIEKARMEHSLEKYNASANAFGHNFMILVGSRIIRESYDLKAIQNIFIMSRPNNIPTLIQIRGRAVRKNSHKDLPRSNRKVHFYIFTSCLPIRFTDGPDKGAYQLSYEEQKYKEKVGMFQTIQKIEKVFHENAIDSYINYPQISNSINKSDPLSILPISEFNNISEKKFSHELTLNQLNISTFDTYFRDEEINTIKRIVKRLFIEKSVIFTHTELIEAVRNFPNIEINTHLFTEDNFLIAIDQLCWKNTPGIVEPTIQFISSSTNITSSNNDELTAQNNMNNLTNNNNNPDSAKQISGGNSSIIENAELLSFDTKPTAGFINENDLSYQEYKNDLIRGGNQAEYTKGGKHREELSIDDTLVGNEVIDRLYDPNDKFILMPNGQTHVIVPIYRKTGSNNEQYYILFPFIDGKPNIDFDTPYLSQVQETSLNINMNNFIRNKKVDFDYPDKKQLFYRKYMDTSIEHMENIICEYGTTFHVKFIEECIEYVFRAWTDPKLEKSDFHEFYFKMLYYYDLMSLIVWAYTAKPRIFKQYTKYAIPVHAKDIKLKVLAQYEKRALNIQKREEEIEEELEKELTPLDDELGTSGIVNMLKSSLNRTSNAWIPAEFRTEYDRIVAASLDQFHGRKKRNKHINRITAKNLPIGHFIAKFPRLYHPERGWTDAPEYSQSEQIYKENNIIIGFDERSATGTHIRFKLRNPIQSIKKYKDIREIEKGTVCKSKSKPYLYALAKKLDIDIGDRYNVIDLCVLIRSKLIRLELKERIKKSNIKYFYFHYETIPSTTT